MNYTGSTWRQNTQWAEDSIQIKHLYERTAAHSPKVKITKADTTLTAVDFRVIFRGKGPKRYGKGNIKLFNNFYVGAERP